MRKRGFSSICQRGEKKGYVHFGVKGEKDLERIPQHFKFGGKERKRDAGLNPAGPEGKRGGGGGHRKKQPIAITGKEGGGAFLSVKEEKKGGAHNFPSKEVSSQHKKRGTLLSFLRERGGGVG